MWTWMAVFMALTASKVMSEQVGLNPLTVKLEGDGDTSKRGRVDILYKGVWGTLCARDMNKNVAGVICKTMGKTSRLARPADGKMFRSDGLKTPYWIVNGCNGTEQNLVECGFLDLRPSDQCEELYDHSIAGVDCRPDPDSLFRARIVHGGKRGSGVVEIYRNGKWGTICGKTWTLNEAKVVCRRQGFTTDRVMPLTVSPTFNKAHSHNRPLVLSGLQCNGDETSIRNCVHRPWGDVPCEWGGRGAVDCESDVFPVTVRLVGGKKGHPGGYVQVRLLGRWANLVSLGWSGVEATVVCRKLGHWWGSSVDKDYNLNAISEESWISDITCTGNEKDLNACAHTGWSYFKDDSRPLAIATCYNDSPRPPLPVITGKSDNLLTNDSLNLNCRSNDAGQVTIRWICQGDDYITRGPLTGNRVSLDLNVNQLTSKHNNLNCQCLLTGGRGWTVTSSRKLNVKYDPQNIQLVQMDVVQAGDIFGLECQSGLADPAVTLRWLNGSEPVNVSSVQYTKSFPSGIRTYQRWFVKADGDMNGKMITCVASSPVANITTFDSVVLAIGSKFPAQGHMALAATHFLRNAPASLVVILKAGLGAHFENFND